MILDNLFFIILIFLIKEKIFLIKQELLMMFKLFFLKNNHLFINLKNIIIKKGILNHKDIKMNGLKKMIIKMTVNM